MSALYPYARPGLTYSGVRPAALNYPYLSHSAVRPAVASVVAPAVATAVAPVAVAPAHNLAPIAGETRVEYHPYNKTVVEYETQYVTQQVPREKVVTDYYPVEY